nr:MAG TPA: hypothetical protein [Bacteriophage sp.]DAV71222.1 MAG TPA: hypothetical protein [Bacteriophage sp.]
MIWLLFAPHGFKCFWAYNLPPKRKYSHIEQIKH